MVLGDVEVHLQRLECRRAASTVYKELQTSPEPTLDTHRTSKTRRIMLRERELKECPECPEGSERVLKLTLGVRE